MLMMLILVMTPMMIMLAMIMLVTIKAGWNALQAALMSQVGQLLFSLHHLHHQGADNDNHVHDNDALDVKCREE